MSPQATLKHCKIILVSQHMEWNNTLLRAMQRSYIVEERRYDHVRQLDELVNAAEPDIGLIVTEDPNEVGTMRSKFTAHKKGIPIIAVVNDNADAFIKAGADYCVRKNEMVSALKYIGLAMRSNDRSTNVQALEDKSAALDKLNNALYQNAPDPVCYIQDGLFMDANKAFYSCFAIENQDALHDLTLLSLATPRSEKILKELLKSTVRKNLTSSETLDMQPLKGDKKTLLCTASLVQYYGEQAIQLHWRELKQGGAASGAASTDRTTGLMWFDGMHQILKNERKNKTGSSSIGMWVFLWIENYRDVWSQDGYDAAEKMMLSVSHGVERFMPPSTIASRFTDDALALFVKEARSLVIDRLEVLIEKVQAQVPEGVNRMVHPQIYSLVDELHSEVDDDALLTSSFRAVKSLSLAQGDEHITAGGNNTLSRNDERRLLQLQKIVDEGRIKIKYLPISHLEADGVPRFSIQLDAQLTAEEEDLELESLLNVAERQNKGRSLDELKLETFLRDVLCYSGDQRALNGFIRVTGQALQDSSFVDWVLKQFKHTGVSPEQLTFEIPVDSALNAFSGALNFAQKLQEAGSQIALTEIGRFDDEVKELLEKFKPDVIKLDMREIDTFDDDEEQRFMKAVKSYADEHNQTIIVDYMESPAQLSRVWPYDLQLLQGSGIAGALNDFNYDFSEPLF